MTESHLPPSPTSDTDLTNENPFATPLAAAEVSIRVITPVPPTKLNPWWSMWIYPRATVRQILDSGATRMVPILAAVYGISYVLDRASMRGVPPSMSPWAVLALAIVIGPLSGFISVYLGGAIMGWIGRRLGGVGTTQEVRTAMAWASVPHIEALVLWIPTLALFGREVFYNDNPIFDAWADAQPLVVWPAMLLLLLVSVTAGIWSVVVTLKCLAEAHQFSAWRALTSVLVVLSPFIFLIFIAVVAGIAMMLQQQGL